MSFQNNRGRGYGSTHIPQPSRGRSNSYANQQSYFRGRGRGRARRGGRGGGRGYRGSSYHNHSTNSYRGNRGGRHHPYKRHSNERYQIEKLQNELNLNYSQKDIDRFREKWNKYTEHQTLSNIVSDIPLISLRNAALNLTNPSLHLQNTRAAAIMRHKHVHNHHSQSKQHHKVFIDNYEVGDQLTLQHLKHTTIRDHITTKSLGDLNWSLQGLKAKEESGRVECMAQRLSVPATHIPVYTAPSLPFRLWKPRTQVIEPYAYPFCMPVSAIVLSAKKHDIDVTKYDFVSLRRSIKRVLSFSEQLNTNFQCINGVIFAEDVPITNRYDPYNFGYQFEMHCCGATAKKQRYIDPEDEMKESAMDDLDEDDTIGNDLLRRMKEEQRQKCVAFRKESDYYRLIEVRICDLKLLLCAEIDCVDDDGKPMELKFGSSDKLISIWSQCLLSGIRKVVQPQKAYQGLCVLITEVLSSDASCYYSSKPHQNAQLLVFYNILKDIQSKLMNNNNQNRRKNDGYRASDIYRLTRLRSHTDATLFKVDDAKDLISEQQWQCLMKK